MIRAEHERRRANWLVPGGWCGLGLLLVLAWHATARVIGPLYVAEPLAVVRWLSHGAASGVLWEHIGATLRLATVGFAIGGAAGAVAPLVLHAAGATAVIEPYIMASAGVPKYAMMPLLIVWFGINSAPKRCLVALLVFYPVFVGVSSGIRSVNSHLLRTIRVLGATKVGAVRHVTWHSIRPFLFAGLQIAVPRAVSGAVIGELLVGDEGLGYVLEHGRQNFDTASVFGALTAATVLVGVINAVTARLCRISHSRTLDPSHLPASDGRRRERNL